MKCSKCNSSFIVMTDDKQFICRKCKSLLNRDGTFLNKLRKDELLKMNIKPESSLQCCGCEFIIIIPVMLMCCCCMSEFMGNGIFSLLIRFLLG